MNRRTFIGSIIAGVAAFAVSARDGFARPLATGGIVKNPSHGLLGAHDPPESIIPIPKGGIATRVPIEQRIIIVQNQDEALTRARAGDVVINSIKKAHRRARLSP